MRALDVREIHYVRQLLREIAAGDAGVRSGFSSAKKYMPIETWSTIGSRVKQYFEKLSPTSLKRLMQMASEQRLRYVMQNVGLDIKNDMHFDAAAEEVNRQVRMKKNLRTESLEADKYPPTAAEYAQQINARDEEDPSWGLVTSQEYWTKYGVHTGEDLARYFAIGNYSDSYKAAYGSRPRHVNFDVMSIEEIEDAANEFRSDIDHEDYDERNYVDDEQDKEHGAHDISRQTEDPLGSLEPDEYYDPNEEAPKHLSFNRRTRRMESTIRGFVRNTLLSESQITAEEYVQRSFEDWSYLFIEIENDVEESGTFSYQYCREFADEAADEICKKYNIIDVILRNEIQKIIEQKLCDHLDSVEDSL